MKIYCTLFLSLIALIAQAQTATPGPTQTLFDQVLYGIGVVLSGIAVAILREVVAIFREKTGIEVTEKQEAQLELILHDGIHFAEEQAHKFGKDKIGGIPNLSKIDYASKFVLERLKFTRFNELNAEQVARLIEAKLNRMRTEKVGTSQAQVAAEPKAAVVETKPAQSAPVSMPTPPPAESEETKPVSEESQQPEGTPTLSVDEGK